MDCIFCRIANGELPSKKVYEDEQCLAFHDINPQAPVHVIIIPKQHLASMDEVNAANSGCVGHIFETIPAIAASLGLKDGYRIISNCGENAGQTVPHLHFHLLGGAVLGEKII